LKNQLNNHDRITKLIEDAVVRGSSCAASEAASTIDEEFILIKKSDLPPVVVKPVYSPALGYHIDKPVARTAGHHKGAPASYYWNRAIDILAIAQYAEQEADKQSENKLNELRKQAHGKLFPFCNYCWEYDKAEVHIKRQVDVVVNLMTQVDELKESK
jgi:hypothetical protein